VYWYKLNPPAVKIVMDSSIVSFLYVP